MNCWICNNPADSGEHRVKASDLKMLFSNVSQKSPIYTKNPQGQVIQIGSLKSKKLKWNARLCHKCNTTRTQRYDFAWQTLSDYLQRESRNPKARIKLKKVFPGSATSSMLDVHLFFVKMFGCIIAEHDIPINLSTFSNSLLNRVAHPHVRLGFGILSSWNKNKAFITPVNAVNVKNVVEFASWYYMVRKVFIDVVYSTQEKYIQVASDTWHPNMKGNLIHMSQFGVNHQIQLK
jgi:hypothetical protein